MKKVILFLPVMLALASWCLPDVIPIPQTAKTVEGHWIGLAYDSRDVCRLVLTNNRGVFGRASEGWEPTVYRVDWYTVDSNGTVGFKLSPGSTNSYPVTLGGRAGPNKILLTIRSPDGGWSNACVLHREETVERTLRELTSAMAPLEVPVRAEPIDK